MDQIYGAFAVDNIDLVDNRGRHLQDRPSRRPGFPGPSDERFLERHDRPLHRDGRPHGALLRGSGAPSACHCRLLDAFQIGFIEAIGHRGDGQEQRSPGPARINRIAYTGGTDAQPADLRWEGLEFSDKDNRVKIDALSLTGFSFAPDPRWPENAPGQVLRRSRPGGDAQPHPDPWAPCVCQASPSTEPPTTRARRSRSRRP